MLRIETSLPHVVIEFEYSIASMVESSQPRTRRKTGILSISSFHRSGVHSVGPQTCDSNTRDALVRLGASKARSCNARVRMTVMGQKINFLLGVKEKMVLRCISKFTTQRGKKIGTIRPGLFIGSLVMNELNSHSQNRQFCDRMTDKHHKNVFIAKSLWPSTLCCFHGE